MKYLCPACERLSDLGAYRIDGERLYLICSRCGEESLSDALPKARGSAAKDAEIDLPQLIDVLDIGHETSPVFETPTPTQPTQPQTSQPPLATVLPLRSVSTAAQTVTATPEPPPPLPQDMAADATVVPEGFCPKCVSRRAPATQACGACGLVYANWVPGEHQPSPVLLQQWTTLQSKWPQPEAHDAFIKAANNRGELANAGRLYRIRLARDPKDPLALRGREEIIRVASAAPTFMLRPAEVEKKRWPRTLALIVFVGLLLMAVLLVMRITLPSHRP